MGDLDGRFIRLVVLDVISPRSKALGLVLDVFLPGRQLGMGTDWPLAALIH